MSSFSLSVAMASGGLRVFDFVLFAQHEQRNRCLGPGGLGSTGKDLPDRIAGDPHAGRYVVNTQPECHERLNP